MDNLDNLISRNRETVQPSIVMPAKPPESQAAPLPVETPPTNIDNADASVMTDQAAQVSGPEPYPGQNPPSIDGTDGYLNKELNDLIGNLPSMLAEEDARLMEAKRLAAEDRVIQDEKRTPASVVQKEHVMQAAATDSNDLVPDFMDDDNAIYSADRYNTRSIDTKESPDDGDESDADVDAVARMVRDYDVVRLESPEKLAARTLRDPSAPRIRTVTTRGSSKAIGDQAFDNMVTNFKRDNCGVVSVPLVNSGFCVDMVGSGVVDVETLYGPLDRNSDPRLYRISQMKTVIRSIAATYPHVDRPRISSMIHRYDFDLMVFGHVCATIKKVQTAITCPKCGNNFRVECDTSNLLLNEDEIMKKRTVIEAAGSAEDNSLLTTRREVETSDGFFIEIGHPTYLEYMRMLEGYPSFTERMDETEKRRFDAMSNMMAMIRSIRLPNGVVSSNLYQHYKAFGLLGDSDATAVQNIVSEMEKDVIIPRLGIREVRCPRCGEVIRDTAFESMADLIFLHATISDLLRKAESDSQS